MSDELSWRLRMILEKEEREARKSETPEPPDDYWDDEPTETPPAT